MSNGSGRTLLVLSIDIWVVGETQFGSGSDRICVVSLVSKHIGFANKIFGLSWLALFSIQKGKHRKGVWCGLALGSTRHPSRVCSFGLSLGSLPPTKGVCLATINIRPQGWSCKLLSLGITSQTKSVFVVLFVRLTRHHKGCVCAWLCISTPCHPRRVSSSCVSRFG